MAGELYMTTDHERIREWVESRGGCPAAVAATYTEQDPGVIRIDFPGYSGEESLKCISWDEWFRKFDENDLVFLFQEELASGGRSNFNKLVSRETAEANKNARWVGGRRGGERRRAA